MATIRLFDDYIVGLNICSLWRNGTHYGWACISAHDEPIPVIGMYDEGNPETADWEIKYMVEHGIDFQAFCWYADQNSAPLKYPSNCEQLHNGYMYAKYSDYMKYCILWEAANAEHFGSSYFRKHVIPYWFENYFLDPRYMTIDNKLLLPIFGADKLTGSDYFGSVEGVKAEFDYLEEEARKHGFDGVLYFACGSSSDRLANMGFDGAYAYNWGSGGKEYQHNVNSITNSAKNQRMYTIPTISVGFDSIPWHGERYGNMTVEDFAKSQEWVKKEYLPKYSTKYDWAENFMWLSTWNEYGEGTFICPANLNGFGYLNEMRKAVTIEGDSFESDRPTGDAFDRLSYIFPKGHHLLSATHLVEKEYPNKPVKEYVFNTPESINIWHIDKPLNCRIENGKMFGYSDGYDPKMWMELDVDADEVGAIEFRLRTGAGLDSSSITSSKICQSDFYFSTDSQPEFSQSMRFIPDIVTDDGRVIIITAKHPDWKGRIQKLRIDPTPTTGCFEMEKMTLLTSDETQNKLVTYIDGRLYESHYRTKLADGEYYVIFEPLKFFADMTRVYYTWDNEDGVLMLEGRKGVSYWTKDSDIVKHEGKEIKLSRKLEMYDNLPYLPLKEFCELTGCSFEVKDDRVDIYTK